MLAKGEDSMLSGRFLLIGPIPPPVTGNAVAFEDLVKSFSDRQIDHALIDISPRREWTQWFKSRKLGRVLDYSLIVPKVLLYVCSGRGPVYLTVAQSWVGFLRDVIFVGLAALVRRKIVLHIHGGNYDQFIDGLHSWQREAVRRALLSASRIILLSDRLLPMLDFEPRLMERVRVIPNGVQVSARLHHEKAARSPAGTFKVLFLSNLIESKGYLALLRAAGILHERYGPGSFEFVFAGRIMVNPEDDREVVSVESAQELVNSIVSAQGTSACVSFLGVVEGAAKVSLLESSHLLVLPTRYNNEGQPISILEAMAFGLPVVSTAYRAIPDMVVPEETGVFVLPDDPDSLASAIAGIYDDRAMYAKLSCGAVEMVQSKFTLSLHLDRMHKLLFEVHSG